MYIRNVIISDNIRKQCYGAKNELSTYYFLLLCLNSYGRTDTLIVLVMDILCYYVY